MSRPVCSLIVILTLASAALGEGTVTLSLSSPSNGAFVPPGSTVEWTITAQVSSGDNLGLAMITVDLTQDPANAARFDIPTAQGVPEGMVSFDRPAGLSNPLASGSVSGYCGTPVGALGERNLAQLGGAQNVFGAAFGGVGLDVEVEPGVGQSPPGQVIAAGVFSVPSTAGSYSFFIQNALANTLDAVNPPPQWSIVGPAIVDASASTISFEVCQGGDANGDAALTDADIEPFVEYLVGQQTPDDRARCACDLNQDGMLDGRDIQPFVETLLAR